jgi:NTE family protein
VVAHIAEVWSSFRAEQVYRADSLSVIGSGARWRMLLGFGRFAANWMRVKPKSLLDNAPLADLLQRMVPLDRLPMLMQEGHVKALAVTASSYSSGEHVTFFEAAVPMEPWVRSQRLSVRDRITHHAPAGVFGHSLRVSCDRAADAGAHRVFRRRLDAPVGTHRGGDSPGRRSASW